MKCIYPDKPYYIDHVIVISWFVCLYVEIIQEFWRVDYLSYRWTAMILLFYTTYISVDLIHNEVVSKDGITLNSY